MELTNMVNAAFTAQREWDTVHPHRGYAHSGQWVVRDGDGNWVDADQYRNDLKCRFPGLVIVGD